MCLNPGNDEFDRAYANVGLLASDVWSFQKIITDYKKANLNLWLQLNDIEQRLADNECNYDNSIPNEKVTRTVRDTIPLSRLASYNDFVYNEQRERFYCSDDEYCTNEENSIPQDHNDLEIWMLPEIEDEFKRLTCFPSSNWSCVSPRIPSGRELAPMVCITTASPYQWLTQTAWPDHLISRYPNLPRALQHSTRDSIFKGEELALSNYSPQELEEKLELFPCPRYLIETHDDVELHTVLDSQTIRQLWTSQPGHYGGFSPSLGLNAEVPEFQPATVRQQQYPSIYNTTYEAELFPYSNLDKSYYYEQHLNDNLSPIFYKEDEVHNIPVFVRPPESYYNTENTKYKWRKSQRSQGAVLSNLIPLTSTGERAMAQPQQDPIPVCHSPVCYNSTSSKTPNTQKMLAFLDKWLSKIYNPRSTDFSSMSTISGRIDKIFLNVQQNYGSTQDVPQTIIEDQPALHRPLYSDVLMSEVSVASCSDSKYDELEREALEQYSGSDPALAQQAEGPGVKIQAGSPNVSPINLNLTRDSKPTVRRVNLSARQSPSPRSTPTNVSLSPGAKGNSILDDLNYSGSKKQPLWAKRKKKKAEKKKKCSKNKKKTLVEPEQKIIETKVVLINKFIHIKDTFSKTFFDGDWSLVSSFITEETTESFANCLNMLKECSSWFKTLVLANNFKKDLKNKKRNLELCQRILDMAWNIINLLHQYIKQYSILKGVIPCDQRLYSNPTKLYSIKHPMNFPEDSLHFHNTFDINNIESYLPREISGKNIQSLHKFVPHPLFLFPDCRHEWMLSNIDNSVKKKWLWFNKNTNNYSHLLFNFTNDNFYVTVKERPISGTRKLVNIVEDSVIWSNWQWRFVNGWKFQRSITQESLHWLNKFSVRLLEDISTSSNTLIAYGCALKVINDLFSDSEVDFEPIWNIQRCNLVRRKMLFIKVLLKQDQGFCFRVVRINKKACLPLISICVNSCCISWMLNPMLEDPIQHNKINGSNPKVEKTFDTKKAEALVNENDPQNKKKTVDRLTPEKQTILEHIGNREITDKPSLCALQ